MQSMQDAETLVEHALWLGQQFFDLTFSHKPGIQLGKTPNATNQLRDTSPGPSSDSMRDPFDLNRHGTCRPWRDTDKDKPEKQDPLVNKSRLEEEDDSIKFNRATPILHHEEYKRYIKNLLVACNSEQQRRTVLDAVQNTRRLCLDEKYDILRNLERGFQLKLKPFEVPVEAIRSLQHNDEMDDRLFRKFVHYRSRTMDSVLEEIIKYGSNLDAQNCNALQLLSSSIKQMKPIVPNFSPEIKPNAHHFNTSLTEHVIGQGVSKSPSVFEAVSLHLTQDETLSTALRVLTYKEMHNSYPVLSRYCRAKNFDVKNLPQQIFDPEFHATPPVLNLLANTVNKNLIIHWGTYAESDSAFSFGNPNSPKLHILALDSNFYPVYKVGQLQTCSINLRSISDECTEADTKKEVLALGTKFTDFVEVFTRPCNLCRDFKFQSCGHVTKRQLSEVTDFRKSILDPKFGSFTAKTASPSSNDISTSEISNKFQIVSVAEDSDSLYKAVSLAMFGTDELALALRKAFSCDFLNNENHYLSEFAKLDYTKDEIVALRKSIYSHNSYGTPESLLLASKITTRQIVVMNSQNSRIEEYNFDPEQSHVYKPIFLVCREGKHYSPAFPIDWENATEPILAIGQFIGFQPSTDNNIFIQESETVITEKPANEISLTPGGSATLHEPLADSLKENEPVKSEEPREMNENQHLPKEGDCVAVGISSNTQPSNLLFQNMMQSESEIVVDDEKMTASITNSFQSKVTKVLPRNMLQSDVNEFLEIVNVELERVVKSGLDENIEAFTDNIMCLENQFWKFRLLRLQKYSKHSGTVLTARARKYLHFCRTDYAREEIRNLLVKKGCSAKVLQSYTARSSEIIENAKQQSQLKRRRHTREIGRLKKETCEYKPKSVYRDYVSNTSLPPPQITTKLEKVVEAMTEELSTETVPVREAFTSSNDKGINDGLNEAHTVQISCDKSPFHVVSDDLVNAELPFQDSQLESTPFGAANECCHQTVFGENFIEAEGFQEECDEIQLDPAMNSTRGNDFIEQQ